MWCVSRERAGRMIWLYLLLAVWAVILALFIAVIAYDECRYHWRQRRRTSRTLDFTRKRVG